MSVRCSRARFGVVAAAATVEAPVSWEAGMAERIVDVFLKDRLVVSYPVAWDVLTTISERDFVDLAKGAMREDGYSEQDIDDAKFTVRDVPE